MGGGRSADEDRHLGIERMDQAQLVAFSDWLDRQESLWREAAMEGLRSAEAVTALTHDGNVRTP